MEGAGCIPISRSASWKGPATNWGPRSDITLFGLPNLVSSFWNMMSDNCSAVIVLLHGVNMTLFASHWSVMTRIESYPFDSGRSVMKSIDTCENGLDSSAASTG